MKLYTFHQSSSAYRVRITLNIKGLAAEMEFVNLTKGEQRDAAYAGVNPQMAIPSLIDENHTLVQSLAIMEYLEEAYPQPPILPQDRFARAHVRALALSIAADTSPLGNLKVRKHLKERLGFREEAHVEWLQYWISEGLSGFEKLVSTSPYTGAFSCGDTPGMADCCLIPQIYNATRWKCDLSPFPVIRRIAAQCEQHPAFQAAHPSLQKDAV